MWVRRCWVELRSSNLLCGAGRKKYLTTSANINNVQEEPLRSDAPPKYPPIFDNSPKGKRERKNQQWHKAIKEIPTVEEKQLELNLAKFFGYWTAHLFSHDVHYNRAEFAQFVTRTNLVTDHWPESYGALKDKVKKFLPLLKKKVEDLLLLEVLHRTKQERLDFRQQKESSHNLIWAIHHSLVGLLAEDSEHIADSQSDLEARLDAFWWSHGIPVDEHQRVLRKGVRDSTEEDHELPLSRPFQYQGTPALSVRSRLPLPALVAADHEVCRQGPPLPLECREPRTRKVGYKFRHGTNVPGVWPDDPRQFGLVTWMSREHLLLHARRYREHADGDRQDALDAQAVLAGFASCLAQACHVGFSPLTELTYPLTAQTVITDGRLWSFSGYQLNSTAALLTAPEEGAPGNVCWSLPETPLYENVTEHGVEGLNEDVLERLLEMYLLETNDRGGINLRPYLDPEHSIEKLEDEQLRTRYREIYLRVMSNRPNHLPKDEINLWEHIYKIRFPTCPTHARKRFFELNQYPSKQRLDDSTPRFIPRANRPEFVPGHLRAASKYEPNPHHKIAALRGRRSERPKFIQELTELESWRDKEEED